ncbi:MAG TPA: hypothetical protein VGI10_19565 [Polyangiaceae bacterium]|jgi:hypothetical protein
MRVGLLVCAACALVLSAHPARASDKDNDWDGGYEQKATRRSGFVIGLTANAMVGTASGYPNELADLNTPGFRQSTGAAFGSSGKIWIGGALTDWFTFGLGATGVSLNGNDRKASGGAFTFHVEGYPLFYQGGALRDLGAYGEFGAGGMKITGGGRQAADGGLMSFASFGVLYEPFKFWQIRTGPSVGYTRMWSQSLTLDAALIEWRLTFYGGP